MATLTARLGSKLEPLAASPARLRHPALDAFTAAQWLRVAGVQHDHHEKIVREVLRLRRALRFSRRAGRTRSHHEKIVREVLRMCGVEQLPQTARGDRAPLNPGSSRRGGGPGRRIGRRTRGGKG